MLTENFFDSDGIRLHYIDYGGEGPPLVLLAGLGGTAQLFRGLAPRLAGRFRVTALTRRGHGRSERPETGYELDTLVEDIRRPDKPASRMTTVYHLADEELRLTHYCSYRNQPRLVATSVRDDGRTIEFELVDVTNLSRSGNRYTHKMIVSLPDEDPASITFVGLDDGQEGALTTELTRVR